MENAVDALKIAAAILIFIIAIASSFSLFGIAKQTADSIITMRDRQAYLESADLDGGILYTSSSEIQKEEGLSDTEKEKKEKALGVTTKGDRIVGIEDVISTVSRYSKEKYGVTIVKEDGTVLARYDSNTEDLIRIWNEIDTEEEKEKRDKIIEDINKNIETKYVSKKDFFDAERLASLYQITTNIKTDPSVPEKDKVYTNYELIWGNPEEIQERIACDFKGGNFEKVSEREENISDTKVKITTKKTYTGKNLISILDVADKIVEVTNEIDNSTYLKQTDEKGEFILDSEGNKIDSNLLQEYTMPTIEIVYIIL